MNRYDDFTDSFISDNIDQNSYMLGYLKGCEDTIKKINELNKIQFSIPLKSLNMKGGKE
jgi:hypothetical protein